MSRRPNDGGQSAEIRGRPSQCEASGREPCPRCQALEARIAELEAEERDAHRQRPVRARALPAAPTMPPGIQSLRLFPHGWGEGWRLRPSPPRRHWMDELPYAYSALPLVMANQWGWQVLCPTDVRVTWDGTPGSTGLPCRGQAQYDRAIKSQFGDGHRHVFAPLAVSHSARMGSLRQGAKQSLETQLRPVGRDRSRPGGSTTHSPSTGSSSSPEPSSSPKARAWASSCRFLTRLSMTPRRSNPRSAARAQGGPGAARMAGTRRSMADQKVKIHQLYRKAEGIEEHLQSVPVPGDHADHALESAPQARSRGWTRFYWLISRFLRHGACLAVSLIVAAG